MVLGVTVKGLTSVEPGGDGGDDDGDEARSCTVA